MTLIDYPRPVTSVHQIEVSSNCNLRCVYCPSATLDKPIAEGGFGRAKEDMSMATFERALVHAAHYQGEGTQDELALTGLGEAVLNPDFLKMLARAREVLPTNLLTISTNGVVFAQPGGRELAEQMAEFNPRMYVSLHRPEKAKLAIDLFKELGIYEAANASFATEAFDWGGALDWEVTADPIECRFLGDGWCVVLADGRVTTCCLDAEGAGVVGHVDDRVGSLHVQPWEGERASCESCHMTVP